MRFRRTPYDKRTTYKGYDDEGHLVYEINPETDATTDVTVEELKIIVQQMHRMDDAEVKRNNKERKLDPFSQQMYDKRKAEFIEKFRTDNGREPREEELPEGSHRSFHYLDAPIDADGENENTDGDHTKVAAMMAYDPFNEPDTVEEAIAEFLNSDAFNDKERAVYKGKIYKRMTDAEIGEQIGTSGQYAGRLWKGIKEKIENNPRIKRFYRG